MLKIVKGINQLINIITVICILLMSIFVFANVVSRYVFNYSIAWSEEMSRFLFVWMVFLGTILVTKEKSLLDVDIFVNKLSRKTRKIVDLISNIIILLILVIVLVGSWKLTVVNLHSYAPGTGIPYAFLYGIGIILSIGMIIIIIVNVYQIIIKKKIESLPTDDNVDEREEKLQ